MIVCDSNVVISAFLFPGGAPDKIFRAILAKRFPHATSPDLLSEIRRVLVTKFNLNDEKADIFIKLLSENSTLVYPTERLTIVTRDDSDNRVLECAFKAQARYLVTGDRKHLLPLKKIRTLRIVSSQNFISQVGLV